MKLPVGPIVDGDLVPEPPYILRMKGVPRPVLAGNAKHEGLVFLALGLKILINDALLAEMQEKFVRMNKLIADVYGPEEAVNIDEVREAYGITNARMKSKKFKAEAIVDMLDDNVNNFALYNFAQNERRRGSKVWLYYFEHHNPVITAGLKLFMPFSGKFELVFHINL
uniref:Carboxylesterase type B domain-containing protein n=1 Tax=Panagrolaimus sp. JU765 TaxID=591449 RepID=A0AC34R508_9BILA